jgi:two-component system chemotaxis response regulator CheY
MKILLIDDDAVSRILLRRILERNLACELAEAVNGRIAWELLGQGTPPDLCVLDVMMPEMGGVELLERIRADARLKTIKVVLCTALSNRATINRVAALGLDGYIVKPFNSSIVLEQLNKAITRTGDIDLESQITIMSHRLGIPQDDYVYSLGAVLQENWRALSATRGALAALDTGSAIRSVENIKQSCHNMGLRRLVALCETLKAALEEIDRQNHDKRAGHDTFNPFQASLRNIMSALEQTDAENNRLTASLGKLLEARKSMTEEIPAYRINRASASA